MNETIKRDIIDILTRAMGLVRTGDSLRLRELSNHTIHNASIFQDEFSISIAVIVYSVSKVIERGGKENDRIVELMRNMLDYMHRDNLQAYKECTKEMLKLISTIDSRLSIFIGEVIKQAQVKKGTKIYDHGISLGRAASILGVSQWEMMEYVGKTRFIESPYERPDTIQKIKFTRGLFE